MQVEMIDIYTLPSISHLSAARCADFSEAAAVCLDFLGHSPGVFLAIEGDFRGKA
jgi:hypothetical protein